MDSLFSCFGRRQRNSTQNDEKCKCKKANTVLQCGHCKSTLIGYWETDGSDGADGGLASACGKLGISSPCMDSRDSSMDGNSPSSANTPTTPLAPNTVFGGVNNGAFVTTDYRPSAQAGITGMSYMPVSKESPIYNMNYRRRGKAVIFNFAQWDNTSIPTMSLQPRLGSEKDKQDLKMCLERLNFQVICYDNLRRQKYDKIIDKIRKEDHSDADCLVIAVMTHGEKNSIYLSDGSLIPVNSVWEEFEANSCPTLAGKPKIFLIQACRGEKYDDGMRLTREANRPPVFQNDVIDSGSFSYVIPNAADIIVAFSCPLGHYSWRHPERGSWFIQSLCKVFNTVGHTEELQSMLTMVAREVAVNYESSTNSIHSDKKKQVPSTSSTLIRKVFFPPKLEQNLPNLVPIDQQNTAANETELFPPEQVSAAIANAMVSNGASRTTLRINLNPPEVIPLQVSVLDGASVQNENVGNLPNEELRQVIPIDTPEVTSTETETVPT